MSSNELARPADFCRRLIGALEASDGRRRRRKRDTTPDMLGMAMKRQLMDRAIEDDPSPEDFDAWLLAQCDRDDVAGGGMLAMARELHGEWKLAQKDAAFRDWLQGGAPSDDTSAPGSRGA